MTHTAANPTTSHIENGKVIVLERTFHAPRELVYQAFTTPEFLRQWWSPTGWEMTHCTLDLQPGGKWHYCMKCVDRSEGDFYGMESWGLSIYQETQAPERLVYTDYFSDAEGTINTTMPATESTLLFETTGNQTRLINRVAYESEEALKTMLEMGMLNCIPETWDRLAALLEAQKV